MMYAYDSTYLEKARTVLARMLDFAVYDLNYGIADFFELFISSGVATRFEQGDFKVLVGMSGVELAYEILELSGKTVERVKPNYTINRSKEYWAGWALAYYQWKTSLSFADINKYIPITYVVALYYPFHEMDIRQFCDKMDELYKKAKQESNLKLFRLQAGLSQRQLAERSGVSIRSIQQYEQRQKNINKAQVETLVMMARVLICDVVDLLEKV